MLRKLLPSSLARRMPLRHFSYAPSVSLTIPGLSHDVRHDWTKEEVQSIYDQPLLELVYKAATVHRTHFDPTEVQQCTLLSIKTGGCTEDCKYCSQSSRYKTFVKPEPTKKVYEVLEMARRAKAAGSTRFCMGSAWREVGKKHAFQHILDMVRQVKALDLEVCCTLGMLTDAQAVALKQAGLSAYNHNLDTSREHYAKVVTTRTYDERLATIANVRRAGIAVCCGGILGLGEAQADRVGLLHTLATMDEHPESVPINALVAVKGTPLFEDDAVAPVTAADMARMIATARIVMPKTMMRLSAGRLSFTDAEQGLMFLAGANSIFNGDTLLTTANPAFEKDKRLFESFGLKGKPAYHAHKSTPYVVQVTHSAPVANEAVA